MTKIPVRVLIVDDELDFVEMFSLRLQETGETVFTAHSGRECLDVLKEERIDVVVLDIKMPGMDGLETLRAIKKRHPLVEVILLTGHGTIETAVMGMKLGAFDYLLKPAEPLEVSAKLAEARGRKQEQEARIQAAEQKTMPQEGGV